MAQGPKDRASDPKRVPKISFPRELTPEQLAAKRRSDDLYAARQGEKTTADRFVPGSQNPVVEMLDAQEAMERKEKLSAKDE
jgi:hypothetical protein